MTNDIRIRILELRDEGRGVNEISRMLSIHPYSVRWALNRGEHLERERVKRKAKGAGDYKCGICGELGHNRRTHGVQR